MENKASSNITLDPSLLQKLSSKANELSIEIEDKSVFLTAYSLS